MTDPARALIFLRLKGFVKPELVPVDSADLVADGLADLAKLGLRLTPAGRDAADAAWASERAAADPDVLEAAYCAFAAINAPFKQIISQWQLRDGQPNDHSDATYDAALLTALDTIHTQLGECLFLASAQVHRLERYAPAFAAALSKVKQGEIRWMAAPVIDSYHTLWFEFHEELIRLTGRTRAAEAAAGTAA